MHLIVGMIIWAIIGVILSWCMTLALTAYETTLSSLISSLRRYQHVDYVGLITGSGKVSRYAPADLDLLMDMDTVVPQAAPAAAVAARAPTYSEYLEGLRVMLVGRWKFLPAHVVDTALANPPELVLSTEPTAGAWSGLMLKAVSGWLASDTGAPAPLLFSLLSPADIEDQLSLSLAELRASEVASAWMSFKDMAPERTITEVMRLLIRKDRPLSKTGDYILGQAEFLRKRACDPVLANAFVPSMVDEERWLSMRFRASDN